MKQTYHYKTIGVLKPLVWVVSNSDHSFGCLGYRADHMGHFSRLVLAWAYILSSRLIEILRTAGEDALMIQCEALDSDNFWDVIIGCQWHANLIRGGKIFYTP